MSADQAAALTSRGGTPTRTAAATSTLQSHYPQQLYGASKSASQTPVHSAHYPIGQHTRAGLSPQQQNGSGAGGGISSSSASPAHQLHSAHMQIIANPMLSAAEQQQQRPVHAAASAPVLTPERSALFFATAAAAAAAVRARPRVTPIWSPLRFLS